MHKILKINEHIIVDTNKKFKDVDHEKNRKQ